MFRNERSMRAPLGVRSLLFSMNTAKQFGCLMAIVLLGMCSPSLADTTAPGDSDAASQHEAAAAIPMDQLNADAQAKLWPVVSEASIYRRLPTETIACDRDMYLTLLRSPELIVGMWQLMDVTEMDLRRNGPFSFDCDDKAGTTSQVELIYGNANMHVYYADTLYEGGMFARPVKGRLVLLLRSQYYNDQAGRPQVETVMDAFIRIDHITAKLVARTLAPLVVNTADHNFSETFRFVGRVSEAAEANGPGMRDLAGRLANVDATTQRRFADVSMLVSGRAVERRQMAARQLGASAVPMQITPTSAASTLALPRRDIELRR